MSSEIFYIISLNLELKRKENKMTQEEKVKAYDNVVNKLRHFIAIGVDPLITRTDVQDFFPELTESEDERIRKTIIRFFKDNYSNETEMYDGSVTVGKAIAWLEKQGEKDKLIEDKDKLIKELGEYKVKYTQEVISQQLEKQVGQKLTDNVEPKFKVGDWITNGDCKCQIAFIDNRYWYSETCVLGDITSIDKTFHLWTIQDAKDGDVLTYKNDDVEWILIYKNIIPESLEVPQDLLKYHALFTDTDFYDSGIAGMISENYASCFNPATKEQLDILEKAMTASGYEWDVEKKKLKRTEKQGEQKQKMEE